MSLRPRAARLAYSTLWRLLAPAALIRYWWRGRREPGYRQAFLERLGFGPAQVPGAVWLHAVSLGETRAAAALVEALRERLPGMRLLLTHGTATGRAAGAALLRPGDRQAWLPLDTPGATRRFLARRQPCLGVLMETEVWPNLLFAAKERGVPMVLANARLSERSARRGLRLGGVMRPAAATLAATLAQTEEDAQRLRAGGADPVHVCGNLKFDMRPAPELLAQGRRWRAAIGRPVVLAAATREGEEAALLAAWQEQVTRSARPDKPLLLVVPRHPQRFDLVATLLSAAGLRIARRSAWQDTPPVEALTADAWVGDSLGEMPLYYAASDITLLGGSFAPFGGQNLIEAAACGCPVVMGPSTFNFAAAAEQSIAAGAAWRVSTLEQAVAQALQLLHNGKAASAQAGAIEFAQSQRGAALEMADRIAALARTVSDF